MVKLLVFGGRDFKDRGFVFSTLDRVHAWRAVSLVIEGEAEGADKLAGEWADERGIHCARVKALWSVHKRAAGPLRNEAMRDLSPDAGLGFPGGRGSDHMEGLLRAAGIEVWRVSPLSKTNGPSPAVVTSQGAKSE